TIRSLLTLRVGDPCRPEDLEEAERELRALSFVQDAWVEAIGEEDGGVVVRVRVQDAWSTRPGFSIKSEGGKTTTRFHLTEVNLLGTGARLEWSGRRDQDRRERTLRYLDPSLKGTHWQAEIINSDNSDGRRRLLALRRPFWKLDEKWALSLEGGDETREDKVYAQGAAIDRWRVDARTASLGYARSPRGLEAQGRLFRWGVEIVADRQRWTRATARPAFRPEWRPYDRDLLLVGGSLRWQRIDFRRTWHLETARRVEDLDLSLDTGLALAVSAPGSPDTGGRLRAWWRRGFGLSDRAFLQIGGSHQGTRLRGGWVNVVTSAQVRLFRRLTPHQTILVHAALDLGENLDGPSRFLLGGETGLRGYRSRAFDGNRRLLIDLEHRFFTPWEVLETFRVGFVGFVEFGAAWDESESLTLGRVHPDVGFGLRLQAIPSSQATTLHLDLALPLDPNGEPGGTSPRFSFRTATTF
ncbi:MAG: BamA/TamA family outer membrane protein, partial [Acidobacteriota bacterium]|nr:BamA/TamA family outer membrane protein [Acidobacteriota bacterium]